MKTLQFTVNSPNHITFFDTPGACQYVCQVIRRNDGFLVSGGYFVNGREMISDRDILEVVSSFATAIPLIELCCGGVVVLIPGCNFDIRPL